MEAPARHSREQREYTQTEALAERLLAEGNIESVIEALLAARRKRKRTPKIVETAEYAQMAMRIIKAMSRRIQTGDVESLADFEAVRRVLDQAVIDAVTGLRAGEGLASGQVGYSWAEIAAVLEITRQAAQEKYSPRAPGQPKRVRNRGRTPGTVSRLSVPETPTQHQETA